MNKFIFSRLGIIRVRFKSITMNIQNLVNNQFKQQFKNFLVNNGVVGYTAGVCVAVSTKDVITSMVSDLLIPGIIALLLTLDVKYLHKVLPKNTSVNLEQFIKMFVSWIFVLITTYFFITFAFHKLFGVDSTNANANAQQEKDKKDRS